MKEGEGICYLIYGELTSGKGVVWILLLEYGGDWRQSVLLGVFTYVFFGWDCLCVINTLIRHPSREKYQGTISVGSRLCLNTGFCMNIFPILLCSGMAVFSQSSC